MTESGSSLLRLIQNRDIPLLDLLVRESVQNALDAALPDSRWVNVSFTVGTFSPRQLNVHLEGIQDILNRRFPGPSARFVAIRDSGTWGLTGPVQTKDMNSNEFGNLQKLVYEISKSQRSQGAGGSWGLGKTVYFRFGIGLVLYYSRIQENGRYQQRLAACMVEDETSPEAMLKGRGSVRRGIAWWGKRPLAFDSHTVPVDSDWEIRRILAPFHLQPYTGEETGTTILLPYVDETALLNDVYPINEPEEERPWWARSVEGYLQVALQRWYAPRLGNSRYPYGAFLRASVNGKAVGPEQMLSCFRAVRELYLLATGAQPEEDGILSSGEPPRREEIRLRGVLKTSSLAGTLVSARLTRRQLHMEPPDNGPSPFQQISNRNVQMDSGNAPILLYTRQPGMVVAYDWEGQWTRTMPHCPPDRFIVAIFVANSRNELKLTNPATGSPLPLEEYIRQSEMADHAGWTDHNIAGQNPRIIAGIRTNIIRKMKSAYTQQLPDVEERENPGLGQALGNLLLPDSGFGRQGSLLPGRRKGGGSSPPPRPAKNKSAFRVRGPLSHGEEGVTMPVELVLKEKPCCLSLQVVTDLRRFEADAWEDPEELGTPFPLSIRSLTLTEVCQGDQSSPDPLVLDQGRREADNGVVHISLEGSARRGVLSSVTLDPLGRTVQLRGELCLIFQDAAVRAGVNFREVT